MLGHNFILSNSDVKGYNPDNDFFDVLYDQFIVKRVYASRKVNSKAERRGEITELLITNLPTEEPVYAGVI